MHVLLLSCCPTRAAKHHCGPNWALSIATQVQNLLAHEVHLARVLIKHYVLQYGTKADGVVDLWLCLLLHRTARRWSFQ
jgi:hypothetical protein